MSCLTGRPRDQIDWDAGHVATASVSGNCVQVGICLQGCCVLFYDNKPRRHPANGRALPFEKTREEWAVFIADIKAADREGALMWMDRMFESCLAWLKVGEVLAFIAGVRAGEFDLDRLPVLPVAA